jgi:hypothetical protein
MRTCQTLEILQTARASDREVRWAFEWLGFLSGGGEFSRMWNGLLSIQTLEIVQMNLQVILEGDKTYEWVQCFFAQHCLGFWFLIFVL